MILLVGGFISRKVDVWDERGVQSPNNLLRHPIYV